MVSKTDRKFERTRRHIRVRTKVSGTAERPRLCVYRSNANIYAQVIDDVEIITTPKIKGKPRERETNYVLHPEVPYEEIEKTLINSKEKIE